MELDRLCRVTLQPALESDDAKRPAERQTCHCNGDVEEHHHVIVAATHGGKSDLFSRELENETSTSEEERRQRLSGRARRKDASWRAKPEEEVRQAAHNREAREEVAPDHVNLHLEEGVSAGRFCTMRFDCR